MPDIDFAISRATTFLGKYECRRARGLLGRITGSTDRIIRISGRFDLTEDELDDVLLHEMIHYHIDYRRLKDKSSHGPLFRSLMAEINSRYGRHIRVRHKFTGEDAARAPRKAGEYIVCVTAVGGEPGVTVCARSRVLWLYRMLPRCFRISGMEWYLSTDAFFERFPRARTPKIYKVAPEDLKKHLATATRMECDGKTLKVKGS